MKHQDLGGEFICIATCVPPCVKECCPLLQLLFYSKQNKWAFFHLTLILAHQHRESHSVPYNMSSVLFCLDIKALCDNSPSLLWCCVKALSMWRDWWGWSWMGTIDWPCVFTQYCCGSWKNVPSLLSPSALSFSFLSHFLLVFSQFLRHILVYKHPKCTKYEQAHLCLDLMTRVLNL